MVRMTQPVKAVLVVLANQPKSWLWVGKIAELAGLEAKNTPVVLQRLETQGWVISQQESPEAKAARGGPGLRRRFYRITEPGLARAREVARRTSQLVGLPEEEGDAAAVPVTDALAEELGKQVRAVWVACARAHPEPKDSWLVEWPDLDEFQRRVEREIGVALYRRGVASAQQQLVQLLQRREDALAAAKADRRAYGTSQAENARLREQLGKALAQVAWLRGQLVELIGEPVDLPTDSDQSGEQSGQQHQHDDRG